MIVNENNKKKIDKKFIKNYLYLSYKQTMGKGRDKDNLPGYPRPSTGSRDPKGIIVKPRPPSGPKK